MTNRNKKGLFQPAFRNRKSKRNKKKKEREKTRKRSLRKRKPETKANSPGPERKASPRKWS